MTAVLEDSGRVQAAAWDYYFNRERRAFVESWLVYRPCGPRIVERTKFTAAFTAYQQRAESLAAGQLALFT